jgi:hypothetical protein
MGEMRYAYTVLLGKSEGKRLLGDLGLDVDGTLILKLLLRPV